MKVSIAKSMAAALLSISCIGQFASVASAQGYSFSQPAYGYNPYASSYATPYAVNPYAVNPYVNPYASTNVFNTHPILSGTLIGTAVGAAGGLAVGAIQQSNSNSESGSALGVDTAIGAGAGAALGAGVGIIRNKALYGTYF